MIKQFILSDEVTLGGRCIQRTGIISFVFPKAQTTIPTGLFYGCQQLSLIVFPSDCTKIEDWVFNNHTNAIDFYYFGKTVPSYDNVNYVKGEVLNMHCPNIDGTFMYTAKSQDKNDLAGELNFHICRYTVTNDEYTHVNIEGEIDNICWADMIYRCQATPRTTIIINTNSLTFKGNNGKKFSQLTSLFFENTGSIYFDHGSFQSTKNIKDIKMRGTGSYSFGGRVFQRSEIQNIEFGKTVTLGEGLFDTCIYLKTAKILGSVSFEQWVFNKCSNFTSLIYCGETVSPANASVIPDIFGGESHNGYPPCKMDTVIVPYDFVGT